LTARVKHLIDGLTWEVGCGVARASAAALTVRCVPHAQRVGHARTSLAVLQATLLLALERASDVRVHAGAVRSALIGILRRAGNLASGTKQCATTVGLTLRLGLNL